MRMGRVGPAMLQKFQAALRSKALKLAKNENDAQRLWAMGFLPDRGKLYAFDRYHPSLYLTDLQREMTRGLNGPYSIVLSNKIAFTETFGEIGRVPEILACTGRGRMFGTIPEGVVFFAKPVDGGGGNGVIRGRIDGGRVGLAEGDLAPAEFVARLLRSEHTYVVTRGVAQHEAIARFFPDTVNTVRVLTMRHAAGGDPFIAAAVLRIGCRASGDVDNFSAGGVSAPIDLATGMLGPGRRKNGAVVDRHPDTGTPVSGAALPEWDAVRDLCIRAMNRCRALVYVGWDVIVTGEGPVLLEGNSHSDVNLLQVHRPLLLDDRVRHFYALHGVLAYQPTVSLSGAPIGAVTGPPRAASPALSG